MIEIDQYQIDSDGSQYILREKKRHPADHKTPNKSYLGQPSFHSTFEQCMNTILNNEMMRLTASDGSALAAIRSKLDNFGANVQNQLLKALVRN